MKEYATRKLRNSDNINRPIDKLMLSELKTMHNSGRLIIYSFLDIQMGDGGYSLGYTMQGDNGFYKPLDISRTND